MNILEKRKATRNRRNSLTCRTFETKVDRSKLSATLKKQLNTLFHEAKWFYNYCLSNIKESNYRIKVVPVKTPDGIEERNFQYLSSQMKQSIRTRLFDNLKSLKKLKEKGFKIGGLKYKKFVKSIPLVQLNFTFYIKDNQIRIQGFKSWIRIQGLDQLPKDCEISNATLVKSGNDFYFNITTYSEREERNTDGSIGIDFGCETQLTFDNEIKIQYEVPVSKRLKRLDRKISKNRNRRNSKKKLQRKNKRIKEYRKITNKKRDIQHKIVNAITSVYKHVCFQNESIHAWHAGNHGKKIQKTGIGTILSALKSKAEVPIIVDKFFPSTQLCPICGKKNKLELKDRTYICECGYTEDRDVKSSICIKEEAMKQIPPDQREFKTREILSSTFFDILNNIQNIKVSKSKIKSVN